MYSEFFNSVTNIRPIPCLKYHDYPDVSELGCNPDLKELHEFEFDDLKEFLIIGYFYLIVSGKLLVFSGDFVRN